MSENIRRHDLRAIGGRQVRVSVSGTTMTASLEFAEMSAMRRARNKYVARGWKVVRNSGLSIQIEVSW